MDVRVRMRQTSYALTAQERAQTPTGRSEARLVRRLGVAIGLAAAAQLTAMILLAGERSLLAGYLVYTLALLGALLVGPLLDRGRRRASTDSARVAETASSDAHGGAQAIDRERRRVA